MIASSPTTANSKRTPATFAQAALAYYDQRCQTLEEASRSVAEYSAVEGIHQLRVEIKKLRAFLPVVEQISPGPVPRRRIRSIRVLFNEAGRARDIDVQQAIVRKGLAHHNLSEYFNYLKEAELAARPALQDALTADVSADLEAIRKYVRHQLERVSPETALSHLHEAILQRSGELLHLTTRKRLRMADFHEIRKCAKATRYALDILVATTGTSKGKAATTRLKQLYTPLGDWRDLKIVSDSVKAFVKDSKSAGLYDRKAYTDFLAELDSDAEARLRQCGKAWRALVPHLGKLPGALPTKHLAA